MPLVRSLPEDATLADLRASYSDLLELFRPYGERLMRGPVLRYVRKLTETPTRMTPQDAAAVYDAGWGDTARVHAVAVCACFNMMNRLVDGAGIVGDAEAYGRAARGLIEHGYKRI